jgi:hypothetical protein
MDITMEHVCRKVGIEVGQHTFMDINYAVLLADKQEGYNTAMAAMEQEASKLSLHVPWAKTKLQNLGSRPAETPVTINSDTVEAVEEFTYLGSMESSHSYSRPQCCRRLGMTVTVMKSLEHVWSQNQLSLPTKICIYSTPLDPPTV